jgi:hypothetical protein
MKKLILALVLVLVMAIPCLAQTPTVYGSKILNAVTGTGTGSSFRLEPNTLSTVTAFFTCQVTWGGTTPTSTVVAVNGSLDNTNFYPLATVTVTASPTLFHIANKPVKYIQGNYVSKVGGDGTTSVTLLCMPGGF